MIERVREFPHAVREIPHIDVELPGIRLAARLWLPEGVTAPVPALLEYLPYRKGDGTAIDDATRHRFFAGHGFASLRVDIRGSGDSAGVLTDEYSAAELADAVALIDWIARQSWCNGRVGMFGLSWGGFNALQVAALRPPALRAVITLCSSDDRYADDVHYMGGVVLARDMLGWATTLLAFNARPPDPETVGAAWRTMWRHRLDATPAFIDTWLGHPQRDAYWRHASVCEDYAAIRVPVLAIGGWADGYRNTVPRLLAGLGNRTRGIIGPWSHQWPHASRPGPTIDFLGEALRWWEHWLKDIDRGVLDCPRLRFWRAQYAPPQSRGAAGQWCGSDLPAAEFAVVTLHLHHGTLTAAPGRDARVALHSDAAHGAAAGAWCPFGPGDLPADQAADDGRSACFDAAPQRAALTLLGRGELELDVVQAQPGQYVAARLCEVTAAGVSLLLCWGVVRVDGPGRTVLPLQHVGHRVAIGHRLRLALAQSYWPMLWPATTDAAIELNTRGCALRLPQWHGNAASVAFAPARVAPAAPFTVLRSPSVVADTPLRRRVDHGRIRHANAMEVDSVFEDRQDWTEGAAAVHCSRAIELARPGWCSRVEVEASMRDADAGFDVEVALRARLDRLDFAQRQWRFRIPRHAK